MKNPIENNEASHNYVIGANVGGIYAENFTLYLNGNNNNFIHCGETHGTNNCNSNSFSISVTAPTPKYNYLTEIYDKLTYSNRAKVMSLIETLLEEQESQT